MNKKTVMTFHIYNNETNKLMCGLKSWGDYSTSSRHYKVLTGLEKEIPGLSYGQQYCKACLKKFNSIK